MPQASVRGRGQLHFTDPLEAQDSAADNPTVQNDDNGDEPLPWLSMQDFYQMVLDVLPAGYRQEEPPPRRVIPGPDLDEGDGIATPQRPDRVLLPPSSGLLRALYLAYGAFYPVDDTSIIQDPITRAPRFVPGSPQPVVPLDAMAKHYFRINPTDRSTAETSQYKLAPWNNVLPSVPILDPNTRFQKFLTLTCSWVSWTHYKH